MKTVFCLGANDSRSQKEHKHKGGPFHNIVTMQKIIMKNVIEMRKQIKNVSKVLLNLQTNVEKKLQQISKENSSNDQYQDLYDNVVSHDTFTSLRNSVEQINDKMGKIVEATHNRKQSVSHYNTMMSHFINSTTGHLNELLGTLSKENMDPFTILPMNTPVTRRLPVGYRRRLKFTSNANMNIKQEGFPLNCPQGVFT